jgi:NAD+ kinase
MSQIILLEKMSAYRYEQLRRTKDSLDKINNCQIIIYSRENPETGELESYLNWKFSICPWNPKLSRNIWQQIERPVFTNEELLADAELSPLLVHSPCYQLALA